MKSILSLTVFLAFLTVGPPLVADTSSQDVVQFVNNPIAEFAHGSRCILNPRVFTVTDRPLIAATPFVAPQVLKVVGPMIESNTDMWTRNLILLALQNDFSKGVELALTPVMAKENAKALSKGAKALLAGKGLPSVLSAMVANRAGTFLAVRILARVNYFDHAFVVVASSYAIAKTTEEYTRPEMLRAGLGANSEAWEAADYWILRPYLFKAISTGSRYALEKVVQEQYLATLRNGASRLLPKVLSDGLTIGISKVGTSALTQAVISGYEITLDAWSDDPMYENNYARAQVFLMDVALGMVTSAVIGAVIPTSLLAVGPYAVIVCACSVYIIIGTYQK